MLSTLLVVGVISHLWCAARLVGIAHHSFYGVDILICRNSVNTIVTFSLFVKDHVMLGRGTPVAEQLPTNVKVSSMSFKTRRFGRAWDPRANSAWLSKLTE